MKAKKEKKMRIFRGKRWQGRDCVIYSCISPDFSTRCVDEVCEVNGKIYYQQIYPRWKVILLDVIGHTDSELARRAAEEIQKEVARKSESTG